MQRHSRGRGHQKHAFSLTEAALDYVVHISRRAPPQKHLLLLLYVAKSTPCNFKSTFCYCFTWLTALLPTSKAPSATLLLLFYMANALFPPSQARPSAQNDVTNTTTRSSVFTTAEVTTPTLVLQSNTDNRRKYTLPEGHKPCRRQRAWQERCGTLSCAPRR